MLIAIILFYSGTKYYCRDDEQKNGSTISKILKCIYRAISNKIRNRKVKKNHWLDYADDKFSTQMIKDVKSLLGVIIMISPITFYWVLYEQHGSTWVIQASQLDSRIGSFQFTPE